MKIRLFQAMSGAFAALVLALGPAAAAEAKPPVVDVEINISDQTMLVQVNGWPYGSWPVSTARKGYYTPRGQFRPFRMEEVYFSKKYDNAPMPHAVFFDGGYAIHGTYWERYLGRPASHGCVRLSLTHAEALFGLVKKYGYKSTRITLED